MDVEENGNGARDRKRPLEDSEPPQLDQFGRVIRRRKPASNRHHDAPAANDDRRGSSFHESSARRPMHRDNDRPRQRPAPHQRERREHHAFTPAKLANPPHIHSDIIAACCWNEIVPTDAEKTALQVQRFHTAASLKEVDAFARTYGREPSFLERYSPLLQWQRKQSTWARDTVHASHAALERHMQVLLSCPLGQGNIVPEYLQSCLVLLRGVPPELSRQDLERILRGGPVGKAAAPKSDNPPPAEEDHEDKEEDDNDEKEVEPIDLLQLSLAAPNLEQKRARFASCLYSSPQAAIRAKQHLALVTATELTSLQVIDSPNPEYRFPPAVPAAMNAPQRITHDLQQAQRMAETLASWRGLPSLQSTPLWVQLQTTAESDAQLLDALLLYLRIVHGYCYYCVQWYDPSQLRQDCGSLHCRSARQAGEGEGDADTAADATAAWLVEFDRRTQHLHAQLEAVSAGESVGSEEDGEILCRLPYPSITVEMPSQYWRCMICGQQNISKLFKAHNFAAKHLVTKHPEAASAEKQEAENLACLIRLCVNDHKLVGQIQAGERRHFEERMREEADNRRRLQSAAMRTERGQDRAESMRVRRLQQMDDGRPLVSYAELDRAPAGPPDAVWVSCDV